MGVGMPAVSGQPTTVTTHLIPPPPHCVVAEEGHSIGRPQPEPMTSHAHRACSPAPAAGMDVIVTEWFSGGGGGAEVPEMTK